MAGAEYPVTRRAALTGAAVAYAATGAAPLIAKEADLLPASNRSTADGWAAAFFGKTGAPALSLAVATADGRQWQAAFGAADLELDVPATSAHSFRLGSVGKILTSTAAARMVSRGTIDLDAPIANWLPDLPVQHLATTLRQLFTHRGGVRHYGPADLDPRAPGGPMYARRYDNDAARLALFINDPLVAVPGEAVHYSTYGYTLASIAMQQADGRPFLQILAEEIAGPFGMASLIDDDPLAIIPMRATGYLSETDLMAFRALGAGPGPKLKGPFGNAPWLDQSYSWAGAGMRATAPDLARFGAGVLDTPGSPLSAAERTLLFTPMTQASKASPPLGLGWRVDRDARGRMRWHHAGATAGGRASLVVYPEQGLSTAIMSTVMTAPGDVLGPSSELADIFAS
jgi:CubicO group peptidase (beta-lactamase class C family)